MIHITILHLASTPVMHNNSMSQSRLRCGSFLIPLACLLACTLASAPKVFGVDPAPDGGYANQNTAEGTFALNSLTNGVENTALGYSALLSNNSGNDNTATGNAALQSNTSGRENTATGSFALANNTASDNTAIGFEALAGNQGGSDNTATGAFALRDNTTGIGNTANGFTALLTSNAPYNTATGYQALYGNRTGANNTATGAFTLVKNTGGNYNTATGGGSLYANTGGTNNTATGTNALTANTTGSSNTADGVQALFRNTTGSSNIALGLNAGSNLTTGNNNIDIGALGNAGEANTIRIGKQGTQKSTFVAGIFGTPVTGSTVVVNSSGKLGVATSSARFKEQIRPMDKASESILALKPVSFRYKEEIDPDRTPQFGLIAEEVEKVNPALVGRDENGKVATVRYEAVNAMLLNEFLKEHQKVGEQNVMITEMRSTIAKLEATNEQQEKQIAVLTAGLQKVSDRLQLNHPVPRLANNQ